MQFNSSVASGNLRNEDLEAIKRFSLLDARRGDVYKVIEWNRRELTSDLTLENHDGEKYIYNTAGSRIILRQLEKYCYKTGRKNPVGLEIVIEKSIYQDGRTLVLIREGRG